MRSTLIKAGLHFAAGLIRLLPKALVPWAASLFSALAPIFLKRDARLIADNIERVYHLAPQSVFSKTFIRQVFRSQALVSLETFKQQFSKKPMIRFLGEDEYAVEVKRLLAAGNGMTTITAHLGSWEFCAGESARASGKKFYALAKPSKLPEFNSLLQALRENLNTVVLWTDSKNILRDMIRVLKEGGNLGFVMDQKPEGRIGPCVDFLGTPTEFVAGPAKLAIRQQSAVIAIFCMRTGPWEYRIVWETLAEANHGLKDEVVLTQMMADAIARVIKLYPEQWIWNYKRWRTTDPRPARALSM